MDNFISNPYVSYLISPAIVGVILVYFLHYAMSFGSFRDRFKRLESDMAVVKEDITTLKVDVAELKCGFKSMQDDLTIIKSILLKSLKA